MIATGGGPSLLEDPQFEAEHLREVHVEHPSPLGPVQAERPGVHPGREEHDLATALACRAEQLLVEVRGTHRGLVAQLPQEGSHAFAGERPRPFTGVGRAKEQLGEWILEEPVLPVLLRRASGRHDQARRGDTSQTFHFTLPGHVIPPLVARNETTLSCY